METVEGQTLGTHKVRREAAGSKRASGGALQKANRRMRRADVKRLKTGAPDGTLSGLGGLGDFNAFTEREGVGRELRQKFGGLKQGSRVVYPMHVQLQTLIDGAVAGAERIYDLEWLAGDSVFRHLTGGAVPSVDVMYDDLRRLRPEDLEELEAMISRQGLEALSGRKLDEVTIDIDTTVLPLFGNQEYAVPGPNPKYKGRPSYHPILARIAETGTVLGARLRPGDTSLGELDTEDLEQWIDRLRETVGDDTVITARIDAGGDSSAILRALHDKECTCREGQANGQPAHCGDAQKLAHRRRRRLRRADAAGCGTYQRAGWPEGTYRVIAARTTERLRCRQTCLWEGLDWSVNSMSPTILRRHRYAALSTTLVLASNRSSASWLLRHRQGPDGKLRSQRAFPHQAARL